MNQFTILVPKRISDLWPITDFVFNKLGIRYDPTSANYTVKTVYDGVDLTFKLGRPEDWLTALNYLNVDAAVTGKDLVVDCLCDRTLDTRRFERLVEMWTKNYPDPAVQQLHGNVLNARPYRFQDAVGLKGLEFDTIKLSKGKGKVALEGKLPAKTDRPIQIKCWKEYSALVEFWLDENYGGNYQLIGLVGSAEAFGSPVIEFTRGNYGTAKKNGIGGPFTEIMDTQSLVICKKDVTNFAKKLYAELMEGD